MKIKTKLLVGFLSISTIILIAGILGIIQIRDLYSVSEEISIKNAPLADAAMEIELAATKAHLWIEEILAGTENQEAIETVWQLLDESLWYVDAMLTGGQNTEGIFFYSVNDRVIEKKLQSVKTDIEAFKKMAQLRAQLRFNNHIGSKELEDKSLDDKFDALFKQIITGTDEVEEILHAKIVQDTKTMENTATISILLLGIATILGFLFATIAVYYISRDILKQVGGEPAEIAKITEQVATGHLEGLKFDSSNQTATGIYAAVQVMVTNLKSMNHEKEKQTWLKTGHAQLNEQMSGEQEMVQLAKNIISLLTTYLGAQVGLFYLLKEPPSDNQKPSLQIIASYAYMADDNRPTQFLLGEGLVGQVALEKRSLAITQTVEECSHIIRSGLANALPRNILIVPFLYETALKGLIEIGSSEPLTEIQREFIEQAMPSIAIAINTAQSRTKMQLLLEQSQKQAEELQHQQDELQHKQIELQQSNEELQSQSEELQSQSEELQSQQEELRQINEALEERTKELERQKADIQQKNTLLEKNQAEMKTAQVALETKARELELASQYKSEFLANMSHELRTPLNSLLILAQLLSDNKPGNLNDKQVEYARTIHSAGNDLLKLINDILDLSKVEAGKMEIHAEAISLTDLVEAVEQKFRPVADNKGVAFNLTVAEQLPAMLHTDGQRLKQIINNLLSNAFKFTSEGEIRMSVQPPSNPKEVAKMGLPTKTIAFSVSDTGIGIPKDKQQLIFEAFQQVDGTTSRRFGGTGLGLSISRQFAQLLGGELQLQSEEGQGTTFTLYLPENSPAADSSHQSPPSFRDEKTDKFSYQAESSSPNNPVSREPIADDRELLKPEEKSLLIIEDDRKFSSLMMEFTREKGFKCLIAEDGATGLQLAEEYLPNAIILDVGLPKLDGWTVMNRLKDNPDTRHIPVHFISATDQSFDARQMGAIGYLLKPVNLEQLGEAFQKIEQFITKTMKNLLVAVDNEPRQQNIMELVKTQEIDITLAVTKTAVLDRLKERTFDCLILDMDIEQNSGIQLLEQMRQIKGFCQTPVIVYSERDLTASEESILLQCADQITIKAANTPERLLDEATLFLHQIEAKMPQDKQNMLRMVHDKNTILLGKKVLIVDDDIRNTFALTTFLEDNNMEVIVGNNGKEALRVLDKHPDVAIVLMDIMMPEMDGYQAMRQIRKQPNFRKLPIIALTAKAMKGDRAKCIEAGANDYLSKPVDTDKLISLMRVWLYR